MAFQTGKLRIGLLAAAAAIAMLTAGAANAQTFGSVSKSTYRDCSSTAAGAACDGTGPGQTIVTQVTTGGALMTSNSVLTLGDGSMASGQVTFGAFDLPVIRGQTVSVVGGQDRMNTNSMGYQSYVYSGPDGTPFSLTGALHIDDSSTDGGSGVLPGGAIYNEYVAIWDPSVLGGLLTADEIFNNVFLAQCGTPGVLAVGMQTGGLPGGDTSFSVTTSSCSGSPLLLTSGEEVFAVSGLQLPVNRGGFVDATHTFVTTLGADLSAADKATLEAGLTSGKSALGLPEPATWAMLILGFFGAGAALRRRQGFAAV